VIQRSEFTGRGDSDRVRFGRRPSQRRPVPAPQVGQIPLDRLDRPRLSERLPVGRSKGHGICLPQMFIETVHDLGSHPSCDSALDSEPRHSGQRARPGSAYARGHVYLPDCPQPLGHRTHIVCPCSHMHHVSTLWSGRNSFGCWFGLVCPDCGELIPCVWNMTSRTLAWLTAPLWRNAAERAKRPLIGSGEKAAHRSTVPPKCKGATQAEKPRPSGRPLGQRRHVIVRPDPDTIRTSSPIAGDLETGTGSEQISDALQCACGVVGGAARTRKEQQT
jgi:hypothetical protein